VINHFIADGPFILRAWEIPFLTNKTSPCSSDEGPLRNPTEIPCAARTLAIADDSAVLERKDGRKQREARDIERR
jgi:hypothetical protein